MGSSLACASGSAVRREGGSVKRDASEWLLYLLGSNWSKGDPDEGDGQPGERDPLDDEFAFAVWVLTLAAIYRARHGKGEDDPS